MQEQTGKQCGALERSPFVASGADRMGDTQGHRTDRPGAHWWGRGLRAETAGKGNEAHQNLFLCQGVCVLDCVLLLRKWPELLGIQSRSHSHIF